MKTSYRGKDNIGPGYEVSSIEQALRYLRAESIIADDVVAEAEDEQRFQQFLRAVWITSPDSASCTITSSGISPASECVAQPKQGS